MTRNLKSLALLVGALLAIGGLMASAASAHTAARFTFERDTVTLTAEGVGDHVFNFTGQSVTCTTVTYHGHVALPELDTSSTYVTISPLHTGCTAFGFAGAKVTGFGHYGEADPCDYKIWANGREDLVCPVGRDVTIEVGSTCIVHIPAQTDLGTLTFTTENKETVSHVKHDLRIHTGTTTTVTHTDLNFLCPFAGSGEISTGSGEGTTTLWAEDPDSSTPLHITWDDTEA